MFTVHVWVYDVSSYSEAESTARRGVWLTGIAIDERNASGGARCQELCCLSP